MNLEIQKAIDDLNSIKSLDDPVELQRLDDSVQQLLTSELFFEPPVVFQEAWTM